MNGRGCFGCGQDFIISCVLYNNGVILVVIQNKNWDEFDMKRLVILNIFLFCN